MIGRPLNERLYDGLVRRFGRVRISKPGMEVSERIKHTLTGNWIEYKEGERYNVNCPFCGDTRQRLQFSYLWGVYDPETHNKRLHLVHCFNDEGLCVDKQPGRIAQLEYEIYQALPGQIPQKLVIHPGVHSYVSAGEVEPPGSVVPLNILPKTHPAVQYLSVRGYSVEELTNRYGVGYCAEAYESYPMMQGRIVIPVFVKGKYVGWQGRYVGELDWKRYRTPKYYNSKQFSKSQALYNFDVAIKYQIICLVEGVATVWALGPQFTACFGSSVSMAQASLLSEAPDTSYLVLLFDGDTWKSESSSGESKAIKAIETLLPIFGDRLVPIQLPDELSPDDYPADVLQSMVLQFVRAKGYSGGLLDLAPITLDIPRGRRVMSKNI